MTDDGWRRPAPVAPPRSDDPPSFEVPLAGETAPEPGEPPPTNWRRLVAVAGLAGVVLGIVVGVVVVTSDDDPSTPTTVDPDELSASITVPPTLPPIDPPTDSPTGDRDGTPPGIGGGLAPLPPIDAGDAELAAFDLDTALAALDEPAPRQARTRYVAGVGGFVLDVTIDHDSLNDRYRIELDDGDRGDGRQAVLLDPRGAWSYLGVVGDGIDTEWVRMSNDEIVRQTGADDLASFARSLLLGPVRSDSGASVVDAGGLASLDGTAVREYTVEVTTGSIPEWVPYVFSPSAEAPPPPWDDTITFTVHADDAGRVIRTTGVAAYGNTEQTVVHTVEQQPRLTAIDLPTSFRIMNEEGEAVADSGELVPDYEFVGDGPVGDGFDLSTAVSSFTDAPPARFTVRQLGVTELVVTGERDPASGLVLLEIAAPYDAAFIADPVEGRVVARTGDDPWQVSDFGPDQMLAGLFDGPVADPSLLADAEPAGWYDVDGTTMRRYDLSVDAADLRVSTLLIGVAGGLDRGAPVELRWFVDAESRLVELHLLGNGGVPGALVQRFDHDGEPPVITVPSSAAG